MALSDIRKRVVQHDLLQQNLKLQRQLEVLLESQYDQAFDRFKIEFTPMLMRENYEIPEDNDRFAELVFEILENNKQAAENEN